VLKQNILNYELTDDVETILIVHLSLVPCNRILLLYFGLVFFLRFLSRRNKQNIHNEQITIDYRFVGCGCLFVSWHLES